MLLDYCSTKHATTQVAPAMLPFNRDIRNHFPLCLFVFFVFPVNKIQKSYTESYNILWYKDIITAYNHIEDLWRKVLRSELSFSREGTCRTKSLRLQCCSSCSLSKVLLNTAAQKITEVARKERTCSGVQKTDRPLAVYITINKNDTPPQTLPRRH